MTRPLWIVTKLIHKQARSQRKNAASGRSWKGYVRARPAPINPRNSMDTWWSEENGRLRAGTRWASSSLFIFDQMMNNGWVNYIVKLKLNVLFLFSMYQKWLSICLILLIRHYSKTNKNQAWRDSPSSCYLNKLARLLLDPTWVTAPSIANACFICSSLNKLNLLTTGS